MASVPLPKAAKGAIVIALLIAAVTAFSVPTGPIMLVAISFAAALSATGMLQRRAWSGYGFALLLALSVLAILFLAITGQQAGNFFQTAITVVLYGGLACLFALAGHMLNVVGGKRGSPVPWVVIAACFWTPFIIYLPVTMASNAMENTLLIGDFLLVDRASAGHPALEDVVALRFPLDRQRILIRRVVGLPGERIHFAGGTLYRNDAAVNEPYVTHRQPNENSADVTVPAGKCFVLGDARADSLDSRNWGFVNLSDILGKPKFIYDSLAPNPADIQAADPKTGEKYLIEPTHSPSRRWDRVFKVL